MNQMQAMSLVQRLTDQQLVQEIQRPSGLAPINILMAEMQRRQQMRGEAQAATSAGQPGNAMSYAGGGPVLDPSLASQAGFPTGRDYLPNVTNAYDTLSRQLMPGGVQDTGQLMQQAGTYLPDRSAAFSNIIDPLQQELIDTKKESQGRALMQMGIAMMGSKSPNFLQAFSEGAGAGLKAQDQMKDQQRQILAQVGQAKLAQMQAQNQRDASVANLGTTLLGNQGRMQEGALTGGIGAAGQQAEDQRASANANLTGYEDNLTRLNQMNVAKVGAGAEITAAQIHADATRYASDERLHKITDPSMLVKSVYEDAMNRLLTQKDIMGKPLYTQDQISVNASAQVAQALKLMSDAGNDTARQAYASFVKANPVVPPKPAAGTGQRPGLNSFFK